MILFYIPAPPKELMNFCGPEGREKMIFFFPLKTQESQSFTPTDATAAAALVFFFFFSITSDIIFVFLYRVSYNNCQNLLIKHLKVKFFCKILYKIIIMHILFFNVTFLRLFPPFPLLLLETSLIRTHKKILGVLNDMKRQGLHAWSVEPSSPHPTRVGEQKWKLSFNLHLALVIVHIPQTNCVVSRNFLNRILG